MPFSVLFLKTFSLLILLDFKNPSKALEGFLKSNKISKEKVFKKSTEKGIFYFYNKPSQKIKTYDLLKESIASLLLKISWKKSMKWGNHDLYWGRPLKSILANIDFNGLPQYKS